MKANWLIISITGLVIIMLVNAISAAREGSLHLAQLKGRLCASPKKDVWQGAAPSQIPYYSRKDGQLIYYGYQLISNTAYYLGLRARLRPSPTDSTARIAI